MSIQHFQTKLGITKYSIVTNSNDSVTLRLMTEHDLAMLYEWLNRSHIVEWWGGEEARPTLADVQEQYLPSVLAQESVTPYIAMLNGEPIGYAQSYVALGSGDGWWEEETDPGVRGIDQLLANASQLGKGLGTKLVRALVELLFNDPEVTKIQTDPSPSNLRAIRCYEKAGFERQGTVTPQMVQPCTWFKHARHSSEHAVLPNPSIEGTSKGWRPWRPSCQTLNIRGKR
jgi:aminoglycoside 6'-N-acetyltransferase-1b